MPVSFTKEFNVAASDAKGYGKFIEGLREELKKLNTQTIQDRPVLPRLGNEQNFFDVTLKSSGGTVTIRTRTDNLYVDGYFGAGKWYQFGRENLDEPLIDGAEFLGFGGGYDDLQRKAGMGRKDIPLGKTQISEAVNYLAKPASANQAWAMLILIQTISEAIRLFNVSNHIVTNWVAGLAPPEVIRNCENSWGALCRALVGKDQNNYSFNLSTLLQGQTGARTAAEAAAIVAMVYNPA